MIPIPAGELVVPVIFEQEPGDSDLAAFSLICMWSCAMLRDGWEARAIERPISKRRHKKRVYRGEGGRLYALCVQKH